MRNPNPYPGRWSGWPARQAAAISSPAGGPGLNTRACLFRRLSEPRSSVGRMSFGVEDYINRNFPKGVNVPTGVSEDEAIRAVQQQFRDAGFDCPDKTARGLVHEAHKRQQNQ
jgi:hypothetical protein